MRGVWPRRRSIGEAASGPSMPRWSDWRAARRRAARPVVLVVRGARRGRRADREVGRVVVRVVPVRDPAGAAARSRGRGRRRGRMGLHEGVRRVAVADRVEDRAGRVADGDAAAGGGERGREALVGRVRAEVAAAAEQVEAAGGDARAGRDRRERDVARARRGAVGDLEAADVGRARAGVERARRTRSRPRRSSRS